MAQNYSSELANRLECYLQQEDWHYDFDEERGLFRTGVNLHCELKSLRYVISVAQDHYILYALPELKANIEKPNVIAELSEFLCRVNYNIKFGCFELDCTDGEVRFRYSVDCEGTMPGYQIMHNSFVLPALTFEHYSSGLLAVMLMGIPAEEAIELCKPKE